MFSKHLTLPVWRLSVLNGRQTRCMIHPQILSSRQSIVTMTTAIHAYKLGEKGRKQPDNFHVRKNSMNFGNGDLTALKDRIQNAGLDELQTMSSNAESLHEVSLILTRLNQLRKEDKFDVESLSSDKKLKVLGDILHENATHIAPTVLVTCLRSLLDMSQTDTHLIQSLEQQTLWLLRKLPISAIVKVLEVHEHHQETPLRKQIYRDAMTALNKRWVEISSPKDLVTLMYLFEKNNNELFLKLEERALDLADNMQPKHLYQILYLLSRRRHRNTPLIRALTYHLNKSQLTLQLNQLTNLMFACSTLSIYDTNLLEKITSALKKQFAKVESPRTICSLLVSSGLLRWRHQELLDMFLGFVENNPDKLSTKEKASVIISLAKLNYISQRTRDLVKTVMSTDLTTLQAESPPLWLDLAWSLAVFNMIDSNTAESVLDPSFMKKLQVGSDFHIQLYNMKLVNINTAAQLEIKDYKGPTLSPEWMVNGAQVVRKSERKLGSSVIEALTTMAPKDRFVKTDIVTPSGYFIDAELYVDNSGEPKLYEESVSNPGNHRLCVKVLDYPDMTLGTVVPTGLQAMSTRHLSALGYKVIEIPYHDLADKSSVVKKVQYLQARIKESITMTTDEGR